MTSQFAYAAAPSLNIAFFAHTTLTGVEDEVRSVCEDADLVVGLGNVDLNRLAALLPANKPALCVLGGRDAERQPPAPFRVLHGSGVTFKDWRVAGICGGIRQGPGAGFFTDEAEADALLSKMPSCDLFLTHVPPAGLPHGDRGLDAITRYVAAHEPIYHFYAHDGNDHVDDIVGIEDVGLTWTVGVSGMLYPDTLQFV